MNAHTQTPWKDGPVFLKEGRAIFVTDETKPGKWQKRLDDKSGVFRAEDARLIAAAPDLLAALQATLALVESDYQSARVDGNWPDVAPVMEQARQAISKASMDSSPNSDTVK